MFGSDHSLQRHFPIDDILLQSGDIRIHIAKLPEIAPPKICVWAAEFWGMHPQISWPNFSHLGSHRTSGKILWRSAKPHLKLGGKKNKEDRNISSKT